MATQANKEVKQKDNREKQKNKLQEEKLPHSSSRNKQTSVLQD